MPFTFSDCKVSAYCLTQVIQKYEMATDTQSGQDIFFRSTKSSI